MSVPVRVLFVVFERRGADFSFGAFFEAMDGLLARDALRFKFVDRTFNLQPARTEAIARFFLERWREGMQLHFEILPDRLDGEIISLISEFPPEGLHLEVGVQSFLTEAQAAISRRQDLARTEDTLRRLREETGALLHADLVAGLPHETWESFREGFDRLLALRPHAIQVGILKRLRGAPIARHEKAEAMVFSSDPPYEILQTRGLSFVQLQRIKRFARYFDLYHNSGRFPASFSPFRERADSPFDAFMGLSDALWAATGRTHRLALNQCAAELYRFLVASLGIPAAEAEAAVREDYHRVPGRRERLRLPEVQAS